jgi:uncharacterized SAM-binding protein YcdF (DUF218 family)
MTYLQPFFPILLFVTIVVCRKCRLAMFSSIALLLFAWPPIASLGNLILEAPYSEQPPSDNVQAIVVLSSSVVPPNGPREEYILGPGTYVRCKYAAWLYHERFHVPILASGHGAAERPYSAIMKRALQAEGVPEAMIWTEDESRSTFENALFSTQMLRARNIHRIALVTEAYHMRRAEASFRRQGIDVVPAPCEFRRVFHPSWQTFIPDWQTISHNEDVLHEAFGSLWYKLRGWI